MDLNYLPLFKITQFVTFQIPTFLNKYVSKISYCADEDRFSLQTVDCKKVVRAFQGRRGHTGQLSDFLSGGRPGSTERKLKIENKFYILHLSQQYLLNNDLPFIAFFSISAISIKILKFVLNISLT
jgi:hypothetical protein